MKILLNTSINVQVNITYCIIIYNKMGKKVPNKNFKDQVFISLKQKSFPKKEKVESIMDLSNLLGKQICVKFLGGREVIGILNGFDQITNMILRDVVEIIRDTEDTSKEIRRRKLGITVIRGPAVIK